MDNLAYELTEEIRTIKEAFGRNFFYYLKKQNVIKEQNTTILELVPSYTKVTLDTVEIFFNKVKVGSVPVLSLDIEKLHKVYEQIPEHYISSSTYTDELRIQIIFRKLIQTIIQKTEKNGLYSSSNLPTANSLLKLMIFNLYRELELAIKSYGTEGDKYLHILPFNLKRQEWQEGFFLDFARKAFVIEFTPVIPVEEEIILDINVVGISRRVASTYYTYKNYPYSAFLLSTKDSHQTLLMHLNKVRTIENLDQSINYVYVVKEREKTFSVYIPKHEDFVVEDIGDKVVINLNPERVKFVTTRTLDNRVKEMSSFSFNKTIYSNYNKAFFINCNFYTMAVDHFYFRPVF